VPRLAALVALVALAAGCGAVGSSQAPATRAVRTARALTLAPARRRLPRTPAERLLGLPPVRSRIVPGYLMVADRNNDRIVILNPDTRKIVWQFPRPGDLRPGQSFHDPDDAFFTPDYRGISTNEEYNQTMSQIDVRTHRIVWSYGHPGIRGSATGYLSNPDDAYELPSGRFMVADIQNCRVLFVNRAHRIVRQIGHAGACGHNPPTGLSSPNGATPLPGGGVLVTEIGGWVDRISRSGRLLYTVRTPTTYPSDAQLLPNGNILVAGFDTPGRVDEITPQGRVVWTYGPSSGFGALDRPSLAVRWPNGMIAVTDDWHHRVVVIDPRTKRIVWSFGHLGVSGRAPGYLDKPDGLDLLPAGHAAARGGRSSRAPRPHLATTCCKRRTAAARVTVRQIGSLSAALSKASAVALPGGRLLVLGGLAAGASTDRILAGPPTRLRQVGRLPTPTHDAAATLAGGKALLFGGGEAVSTDTVVQVDPRSGAARTVAHLDEPLSDLGAVSIAGKAYLVGGYTGSKFATAVLRYAGRGRTSVVARLPAGTRYAGVAAIGSTIYVAGGLTTAGATKAIYAVDVAHRSVRRLGTLPAPEDHAALAALRGELYVVGGTEVLRIDPRSGGVAVAARLPAALQDPAAVTLGNRVVVIGGGPAAVYALTAR
jgi:hypothetical protein